MEHLDSDNTQVETFLKTLQQLPDLRDNRGKRHSLTFLIAAIMMAILSGKSTTSALHRYIENKISLLRKLTKIEDAQLISRAHLPRLLDQINWEALDSLIMAHFNLHLFPKNVEKEWTGIDGKALRGSLKSGEKQAIVHAVTHNSQTEVAQARQSGDKSSEIPVVRELLNASGLETQKITLDAHHINPTTLSQIATASGIYLVQVKENQPILFEQCQKLANLQNAMFSCDDHDKSHGRLTSRYAAIYPMNTVTLDARWATSSIQTLVVIKRETLTIKTNKSSTETSYYLSNSIIKDNDLEGHQDLVKAIRGHWGVESNNWILDVTFNEDNVRIKAANQSHIMARLRGFAVQLLRKEGVKNFQAAIEEFADSSSSMETMLRQVNFL
jgi:predicted transposase YbfD/YdcC